MHEGLPVHLFKLIYAVCPVFGNNDNCLVCKKKRETLKAEDNVPTVKYRDGIIILWKCLEKY